MKTAGTFSNLTYLIRDLWDTMPGSFVITRMLPPDLWADHPESKLVGGTAPKEGK